MKFLSKVFIPILLLVIIILNTNCEKKIFSKVTYEGYLYDTIGGKPIQGVWIVLQACDAPNTQDECDNYTVGQSVTDASGHFYIHNDAARSNRYSVEINGTFNGTFLTTEDDLKTNQLTTLYLK
jgi:hypothetical protein